MPVFRHSVLAITAYNCLKFPAVFALKESKLDGGGGRLILCGSQNLPSVVVVAVSRISCIDSNR